jgi:predicted nucleotidyltransferase
VIDAATRRGGHNVRIFGSVARGEDADNSDIDLLVDFDSGVGLVDLVGLGRELTELLGADVDVVPGDALKPGLRDRVLAEAIPL